MLAGKTTSVVEPLGLAQRHEIRLLQHTPLRKVKERRWQVSGCEKAVKALERY